MNGWIIRVTFIFSCFFSGNLLAKAVTIKAYKKVQQSGLSQWVGAQISEQSISAISAGKKVREVPYYIAHDKHDMDSMFEEWHFHESHIPASLENVLPSFLKKTQSFNHFEVRTLLSQGPTENRIDLTVLGDGYTLAEKDKFFADVEFLIDGLFSSASFSSYLPLFNVHAVFVPSNESGIGDGSPIDTVFELYRRPRGSKRGIMPGNEQALVAAENLAPDSDYPIVLANDDYYGGLGGRWAITTRSRTSGLKVLRHELGHNFGEVGEEYDNGYVYRGANSSISSRVNWQHWLDTPDLELHEAQLLSGDYVWQELINNPYERRFRIPALHKFLQFNLSSVGWESQDAVEVKINGNPIDLEGSFHTDRNFYNVNYEIPQNQDITLSIEDKSQDGDNVLGFALAYSMPADYNFEEHVIGAFATYNNWGRKSYRPTHKSCLMRDMNLDHFCPIDQENMWEQFLSRISLIDALESQPLRNGNRQISLAMPKIGNVSIRWKVLEGNRWRDVRDYDNLTEFELGSQVKSISVEVILNTPEIRKSSRHFADQATLDL